MRHPLTLPAVALLLALAACNADRAPATDAAANAPADSAPTDNPAPVSAESTPPAPPAVPVGLARFDGYGDLRFGIDADAARQAWDGDLNGAPAVGEGCYYLNPVSNPAPSHFALMIEGGKFVRYDVGNDVEVAPGGGTRGMQVEEILRLYPGRVEEAPHKYVVGAKVLRIKDGTGNGVLVFETDAAGKVSEWRVGVPPQVDYVEGCS